MPPPKPFTTRVPASLVRKTRPLPRRPVARNARPFLPKNPMPPLTLTDLSILCARPFDWIRRHLQPLGYRERLDNPTRRLSQPVIQRLFWLALLEDWSKDLRAAHLTRSTPRACLADPSTDPFTQFLRPLSPTRRLCFLMRSIGCKTWENAPVSRTTRRLS